MGVKYKKFGQHKDVFKGRVKTVMEEQKFVMISIPIRYPKTKIASFGFDLGGFMIELELLETAFPYLHANISFPEFNSEFEVFACQICNNELRIVLLAE